MTELVTVDMPVGLHRSLKRWASDHETDVSSGIVSAVREMLATEDEDAGYEVPRQGNGFLHQLLS